MTNRLPSWPSQSPLIHSLHSNQHPPPPPLHLHHSVTQLNCDARGPIYFHVNDNPNAMKRKHESQMEFANLRFAMCCSFRSWPTAPRSTFSPTPIVYGVRCVIHHTPSCIRPRLGCECLALVHKKSKNILQFNRNFSANEM